METAVVSSIQPECNQRFGRNILLIDENAEALSHSAKLFEAEGFRVCRCSFFEEGIRAIDRQRFDLVIIDKGSVVFEGRLVVRHLHQRQPLTPFVVLADTMDVQSYLVAMELGALDYLEKPVLDDDVHRVLRSCFGANSDCPRN